MLLALWRNSGVYYASEQVEAEISVRILQALRSRRRVLFKVEASQNTIRFSEYASWWLERGGPTRSHPEHGSEMPQRRRY